MMTFFSALNSLDFQYFFKRGQTSAMSGDLLCWPEISFPAYSPSILTTVSSQWRGQDFIVPNTENSL